MLKVKVFLFIIGIGFLFWIYRTQPEAVISSIGSCIGALIAVVFTYHYNNEKTEYRKHIDCHRKCLWVLNKNLSVLKLALEQPDVDLRIVADQLEDIDPYLLDRFPILDEGFGNTLLQYQCLVSRIKVCPRIAANDDVLPQFRSTIAGAEGKISFLEMADDYFLIWFLLPSILKYIKKWIESKEDRRA